MNTMNLDGQMLTKMLVGGAKNIKANSDVINQLNVFPVPDGDTGTNMTKTFEKGVLDISAGHSSRIDEVFKTFSHGLLLGARGNSGVILSQIFKGIQTGLDGYSEVDAKILSEAYKKGIKQSYSAVVHPVEGTILTVFREGVEYASQKIDEDSSIEDFFRFQLEKAKDTLDHTKEMLPALREADVIDSGGAGYVCITEGMLNALSDDEVGELEIMKAPKKTEEIDISSFTKDSELKFGYCTELLVRLQSSKVDVDNFDVGRIIAFLTEEGGESIVAFKEADIVKIHVHTKNPGNVLNECRKFGEFLTVKIENMALQHEETIKTKKTTRKKVAVVAVASGAGIASEFRRLGADAIVDGGQTENPSAGDFINAFSTIDAQHILVLPNNSNILLTAQQAAELYDRSTVHVIHSRTQQEGYSALSVFTSSFESIQTLISDLQEAIDNVVSGEVALAVRDAEICGKDIHKGDYLALHKKDEIISDEVDKVKALMDLLSGTEDISDREILTIFYGNDVTETELNNARDLISQSYPDLQVDIFNGKQDVYSFLVGIE